MMTGSIPVKKYFQNSISFTDFTPSDYSKILLFHKYFQKTATSLKKNMIIKEIAGHGIRTLKKLVTLFNFLTP